MKEVECEIKRKAIVNNKPVFIIKEVLTQKQHAIPFEQLESFSIDIGEKRTFYREYDKDLKKSLLKLKLKADKFKYEVGRVYEFIIIGFEEKLNRKGELITILLVEDLNKNILKVAGLKWQKSGIWKFETVKCEIRQINSEGLPVLGNQEDRHPIYEIRKDYEFKVLGINSKVSDNKEYNYYELQGEDGCIHEVNMLPGQVLFHKKPDKVRCQLVDITYRLKLNQINIEDPFFVKFDNILSDEKLSKKYFHYIFSSHHTPNPSENYLIEQYNSKSAFWVLTYTDKILSRHFRDSIFKQDYKQAKEINSVIIIFEKWIITKGIITAINDDLLRENTQVKAKKKLESAKEVDLILDILIQDSFNFLEKEDLFSNKQTALRTIFLLVKFSNIKLINEKLFIIRLKNAIDLSLQLNDYNQQNLNALQKLIYNRKKAFVIESADQYFNLTSNLKQTSQDIDGQRKHLYWSFGELLIAQAINKVESSNILTGQILRQISNVTENIDEKYCLLINAYKYLEAVLKLNRPYFIKLVN